MELNEIVAEHLFPRLVADRSHPIYRRDLGRHMVLPAAQAEEAEHPRIRIHMMEDICLNFVQDAGEGAFNYIREIDRADLSQWDDMSLISRAFINLRDIHGDAIKVQQLERGGLKLTSPGRHDASFLLLGNLWTKLEEEYGANLYAAVPSQHMLFIAPQDDRFAVLTLQSLVRDAFFEAPEGAHLSKAIYRRYDGEWKVVATAF